MFAAPIPERVRLLSGAAIVPVAVAAYVATNLDNTAVLVALLARYRERRVAVAAGYLTGMAALIAIGFGASAAAAAIPVEYLGLLGIVPIGVGCFWLLRPPSTDAESPNGLPATRPGTAFVVAASSQLANGTDSFLTFSVLFADSSAQADILTLITLSTCAAIVVLAALYGTRGGSFRRHVAELAMRIAPYLMIAIGVYVLADTATDVLTNDPPLP